MAAETQLLAMNLLKLQGAFEADGESESNISRESSKLKESLVEESSDDAISEAADELAFEQVSGPLRLVDHKL